VGLLQAAYKALQLRLNYWIIEKNIFVAAFFLPYQALWGFASRGRLFLFLSFRFNFLAHAASLHSLGNYALQSIQRKRRPKLFKTLFFSSLPARKAFLAKQFASWRGN
jgi:hypothetical protein